MLTKVNKNHFTPVYTQIKEQLKVFIKEKRLEPGTRLPNVREIAEATGVSLRTADFGLKELVKEGECFRRPKKGTFVAIPGEALNERKKIVAVFYPQGESSLENNITEVAIYRGISAGAVKECHDVLFMPGNLKEGIEFYQKSREMELMGVLFISPLNFERDREIAELYPELKFIYLNYSVKGFEHLPKNIYGIFNDDFGGAYQMTEYLISRGHRNIAFMNLENADENYRNRLKGYLLCLSDHNIRKDDDFILTGVPSDGKLQSVAHELAIELFKKEKRPTAIFCVNDLLAAEVAGKLAELGENQKIEIAGYDNILPDVSRENQFSTVHIDFQKMGAVAIEMLSGGKKYYPKQTAIYAQLIIRNKGRIKEGHK